MKKLMRSIDVQGFGRVFPVVWGPLDDRAIAVFRNPSDARSYDAEKLILGRIPCTFGQPDDLLRVAGANRAAL